MAAGRAFQGQGMNRTRLMMIGVLALAVGFLAAVYVYRNLQPKSSIPADTAEVMVAANDLQVGARVEDRDVWIMRMLGRDMPPGAPRKKADVIAPGCIIPSSTGEVIPPN